VGRRVNAPERAGAREFVAAFMRRDAHAAERSSSCRLGTVEPHQREVYEKCLERHEAVLGRTVERLAFRAHCFASASVALATKGRGAVRAGVTGPL
jgi:hypothetical protein